MPAEHTSPAPHTEPQASQLAGSSWVSTQTPLHSEVPPTQERAQVPAEHTSPAPHTEPQAPQLAGSSWVSTQTPPHSEVPPTQERHRHWRSTSPAPHTEPQAPQLAGSSWVSTQRRRTRRCRRRRRGHRHRRSTPRPHRTRSRRPHSWRGRPGCRHTRRRTRRCRRRRRGTGTGGAHLARTAQSRRPQLAGSSWVSTQTPLHSEVPPTQERAQAPAEHTSPAPQTEPHAPQLSGSIWVSTHTPPHSEVPPKHIREQLPPEQISSAPHTDPQAPQFSGSLSASTQLPPQSRRSPGQGVPVVSPVVSLVVSPEVSPVVSLEVSLEDPSSSPVDAEASESTPEDAPEDTSVSSASVSDGVGLVVSDVSVTSVSGPSALLSPASSTTSWPGIHPQTTTQSNSVRLTQSIKINISRSRHPDAVGERPNLDGKTPLHVHVARPYGASHVSPLDASRTAFRDADAQAEPFDVGVAWTHADHVSTRNWNSELEPGDECWDRALESGPGVGTRI